MKDDLSATDRCVKCGLCLPHCPTFALTGNEADSPRGRISLIQMLDQAATEPSPGLYRHLDQCLQCHACEAMCPSKVPFGELMDSARARLEMHRKRTLGQRLVRKTGLGFITSTTARTIARHLLSGYQGLRLDRLVAATPGIPDSIKRWQTMLPPADRQASPVTGGVTENGNLNLFTGCTGDLFDRATLRATRRLLGRLGYRVNVNAAQTCCGALHLHSGDPQTAARLATANLTAFADNVDPIITFASGCGAQLLGYTSRYPDGDAFSNRVTDVLEFLARRETPLTFKAYPAKVAVHVPCTHRNVLRQQGSILRVLSWIPGLEVDVVNPAGGCCGAAGSYMLTQPELSLQLGRKAAADFSATQAGLLLTTNIGCALQLRAATHRQGKAPEILHPVTLLERLLIDDSP